MVIDSDGTKLGLLSRDEALRRAKEQELDLVEVAPNIKPPVAKILDFKKFKYEESKKEQAAKKHAKDVELKEIWLSPRIAEHDLQTRLNRVDEFLKEGHKIMFRVKFKGREMAHLEFGFQLLTRIFATLEGKISIEREPKVEGRSITAIVGKFRPGAQKENKNES
ncbi:translation initiation factor IF-3 [Candidatus Daviesbacteria bacterium]|nr:translation initiation factor IF-3 [Candidatus Daviesbacteria bacterium]